MTSSSTTSEDHDRTTTHDHPTPATRRRVRASLSGTVLAILVVVSMVWIGAVAVVASGGHLPSISLGSGSSAVPNTKPAYLYFTITTSASTGYDTFYPANVTVPVNQPIIVTITDYDDGVNNVSAPYDQVIGTQGGSATFNDGIGDPPTTVSSLTNGNISHTFTVVYPGAASRLTVAAGVPLINVPIPQSPDGIIPVWVTFSVIFTTTGHYVWTCLAPCDPYSMDTPGFMIGSIEVV